MTTEIKEMKEAAKKEGKPAVSGKLAEMITAIETMTVLELSQLVKALEEHFGVTAAVPVTAAGGAAPAAGAAAAAAQEEKATFEVILAEVGANKIQVIKELRSVTTLGLKEAKDLVDSAPKPVKAGASKEEAQNIKQKLEAVGAKVELK